MSSDDTTLETCGAKQDDTSPDTPDSPASEATAVQAPPVAKKTRSQIRAERQLAITRENLDIAKRLEEAESKYPTQELLGRLYLNWMEIQEIERLRNESHIKEMGKIEEENLIIAKRIEKKRRRRGKIGEFFSLNPDLGSMFHLIEKKEKAVLKIKMATASKIKRENRELYGRLLLVKGHYGQEGRVPRDSGEMFKQRKSQKEMEFLRMREGNENMIERVRNARSEYGQGKPNHRGDRDPLCSAHQMKARNERDKIARQNVESTYAKKGLISDHKVA